MEMYQEEDITQPVAVTVFPEEVHYSEVGGEGVVAAGKECSTVPTEPMIIVNGLKIKLGKTPKESFTYALFPGIKMRSPVDWKLLETDVIEGEHIRCHQIQGNENFSSLLQTFEKQNAKAVLLINTSNDYHLAPGLLFGVQTLLLPVGILTKSDGDRIMKYLENIGTSESIQAKLVAESTVDEPTETIPSQHQLALQHQPASVSHMSTNGQSPENLSRWGRFKNWAAGGNKLADDLKAQIKIHMFDSNGEHPIPMTEDQKRFTMMMSAFHNYEKHAKGESDHKELNDIFRKLLMHMERTFLMDVPYYLFLIYRVHIKCRLYMCEDMNTFIREVIQRMESKENMQHIVQAMHLFMARGDFQIMYNPNNTEYTQNQCVGIFQQLERSCLELVEVSHKIKCSLLNIQHSSTKPFYQNFLYSRMVWVSIALKINEKRTGGLVTRKNMFWDSYLIKHHVRLILSSETISELKDGLEFGQLLQLQKNYRFTHGYLTDFLATEGDKNLRTFMQLKECLESIRKFFGSSSEVVGMLGHLRAIYSGYWKRIYQANIKGISNDGTWITTVNEGIQFLDMMREWLLNLQVAKEVIDKELTSWLNLLLKLFDITGTNTEVFLVKFTTGKAKVISEYKNTIQRHIVVATQEALNLLSIQQFTLLYKNFKHYPKSLVEEFLKQYYIYSDIKLSDPTWKEFFSLFVERYQSAETHSYLAVFLERCSSAYKNNNRPLDFVMDLLEYDMEKLLYVPTTEDRNSREIRDNFSTFIIDFISRNNLVPRILDKMVNILLTMAEKKSQFQTFVLDIVGHEVVPDVQALLHISKFKDLMTTIINMLKSDLSWFSNVSPKQALCWSILATCVSKIVVDDKKIDWVKRHGVAVRALNLGAVYARFCESQKLCSTYSITDNLPILIRRHSCDDLLMYFKWIAKIQCVLQNWKRKIQSKSMTYDEISNYSINHSELISVEKNVRTEGLVVDSSSINNVKSEFLFYFETLNAHLLKYITNWCEGRWLKLPSVLETFGVSLPKSVQNVIMNKVGFPGENLVPVEKRVKFLQPNTSGMFKPGCKISLSLHVSLSLKELIETVNELQKFVEPFLDYIDILVFFKLHDTTLCDKYVRCFLKKNDDDQLEHSFSSSVPLIASPVIYASSHSSVDRKKEMNARDNLVDALFKTRKLLFDIMNGTATYSEIVAEDEEIFNDVDIKREFAIINEYGKYIKMDKSKLTGLEGVQCMLELLQCTTHVSNIYDVCNQYKLIGCLEDPDFKELHSIIKDHVESKDRFQLTIVTAKKKMMRVCELLHLEEHSSFKSLEIFAAMKDSADFYKFLQEKKFYGSQGQVLFQQQYELITAQLQHEEYDEYILNHLLIAFKIITPFMDQTTKLAKLMDEIISLNEAHGFKQLYTVNSNITLIRLWFSRAEGDTLENVAKELKCIMKTGSYMFHLGSYELKEQEAEHMVDIKGQLYLEYELTDDSVISQSADSEHTDISGMPRRECKSNEQVEDFLRKLGIMDSEREGAGSIKQFLHLSQTAYKILNLYQKLRDLGHPHYLSSTSVPSVPCSMIEAEADKVVQSTQILLENWNGQVSALRSQYQWLLYLNMPKLMQFYQILYSVEAPVSSNYRLNSVLHEVSFLIPNVEKARSKLKLVIKEALNSYSANCQDSPMSVVGQFLDILFRDHCISFHSPTISPSIIGVPRHHWNDDISKQSLFYCSSFSNAKCLLYIFEILGCIPEAYQILRCQTTTSEEELDLFLKRTQAQPNHYLMLDINKLPFKLQEQIVRFHLALQSNFMDMSIQALNSTTTISFMETSPSILREMPWISLKEIKEPIISVDEAKSICECVAKNLSCIQLVYSSAGDGKTYYIKDHLSSCHNSVTIAINEAFTPSKAISKLRSLPLYERHVGLYFNFTILPPGEYSMTDLEHMNYQNLMDKVAWFFFDLLVLGYAEDVETGLSFRIPGELEWEVYIEVPSRHNYTTAEEALRLFYAEVPTLQLFGTPHYVHPDVPFKIDEDVQLVCKYLLAYKTIEKKQQRRIDKLYRDSQSPIKFSSDSDLSDKKCHDLLQEFMPKHVLGSKITQQLFIRYMTRRCKFLDTLSNFNFNTGVGELIQPKDGKKGYYTDTRLLGSTLMSTMLKEVSDFCDPTMQENLSERAYQQLIYDFKDGGSSFGLIFLHPENLNKDEITKFEQMGISVPVDKICSREVLDSYLSRALNAELEGGRLSIVDKSNYVLTQDYTIKMLNIHERHECGIPVIIEGETGVGKTALVEMLSKLWNQSLLLEWTRQKSLLMDFILKKLGDCPISDTYQACLQAVEAIVKNNASEEALLDLCNHSANGETKLYIDVLNYLLPMRNYPVISLLSFEDHEGKSFDELFELSEQKNNPQMTARLMHAIFKAQMNSSFHKINVHAAMTPGELKKYFVPVIEQANHLQTMYEQAQLIFSSNLVGSSSFSTSSSNKESLKTSKPQRQMMMASHNAALGESKSTLPFQSTPFVTVFLDEVNTSSCLGLFKEIVVDRTIDGETIPSNVFIVAACNPHRGNSLASHKSSWLRGTYNVHSLHPTLKLLMWNYGSLDEQQEREYIKSKMEMFQKDHSNIEIISRTNLIAKSQIKMRYYASEQLKADLSMTGTTESIKMIQMSSRSCVSQRDIQRVFTFYEWLIKLYNSSSHHKNLYNKHRRALLISLGIVYYMRLNGRYRKLYAQFLNESCIAGDITFNKAFQEELDYFMSQIELPKGIARTLALKENIFATIVCAVTHTPLIIVGAPGSSKTLSFNLTIANLKGLESKKCFFRNIEIFQSLDPHFYQCSRRTTSNEIQTVFSRAINRQRSHKDFNLPINCVVFMDEAGLPEESHESLKVLHYHLDKQEVSFVAITNHILDAAKTNRAISLFRPEASDEDLETLAKGCLCSNPYNPPVEMKESLLTVVKFCKPYIDCMRDPVFSDFFGLRDFIHFVNFLRRKRDETQAIISPQIVLQALERNFNGSKEFQYICNKFLQVIGTDLQNCYQRGILEILEDSMQDRPQASQNVTENEVRYKLIIDPSEDDSLVRSVFSMGVLSRKNTRMFVCSNFPGDGQVQKINTIAAIRHSAMEGHTAVMSQTDDIHESFYDLFNQRFRRIDDPEHGPRYYTNISIGAHLKPSRVHPDFQCIVVVKKSEIDNKSIPGAFLNRFEKYFISHGTLLEMMLQKIPACLASIISSVKLKVNSFIISINGFYSIYGLKYETLDSLILSILPPCNHTYKKMEVNSSSKTVQRPAMYLIQEILVALQRNAGFDIPEYSIKELEEDTKHLFQLVEEDPKYEGLFQILTHETVTHAVPEAFNLLFTAPGPTEDGEKLELTAEGCLVISLLQQFLVCYLVKRIIQLMTTEAIILYRNCMPKFYLNHYFSFQEHFSLKNLICTYCEAYIKNKLNPSRSPNKLIVYSRSSPLVHSLPAQFSCENLDCHDNLEINKIKELIFPDTNKVVLQKLSGVLSQSSIQELLKDFVTSKKAEVFVLLANMQDASLRTVNHIRVMIEEAELRNIHQVDQIPKVFVVLLHFPPALFFNHCYPTLFLKGWNHIYLDTINHISSRGVVDVQNWFLQYQYPSAFHHDTNARAEESDPAFCAAKFLLPEAIPVLSAQMHFGTKDDNSLNSSMNASQRGEALKKLFNNTEVGTILCKKFSTYWKPKVMLQYLERAANFSKLSESSLSITDTIQTQFKTFFLNFCVYILTQANEHCNLDIAYEEEQCSPVHKLFSDIFYLLPIPKLSQLEVLSNILPTQSLSHQSHFPFFTLVCNHIEKEVKACNESVNQQLNLLADQDGISISNNFWASSNKSQEKLDLLISAVTKKLESLSESSNTGFLALVMNAIQEHMDIWNRYFSDFISYKLNLEIPGDISSQSDIAHRLLYIYFGWLHECDILQRLSSLHCYVKVHKLNLARTVMYLRPLSKIKKLHSGSILHPPLASKEISVTSSASPIEEQLIQDVKKHEKLLGSGAQWVNFVISTLFEALVNTSSSKIRLDQLELWFKTYRDIVMLPTMKQNMYMYISMPGVPEQRKLEIKFDIMQVTFITIRSCHILNEDTLLKGSHIFQTLFEEHFDKHSNLLLEKGHANLEGVTKVLVKVLDVNQSCQTSREQCHLSFQHVLGELLLHYCSPNRLTHHREDILSFLKLVNKQTQWKHIQAEKTKDITSTPTVTDNSSSQEQLQFPIGVITLNRGKYHLSCILGYFKETSGLPNKVEGQQQLDPSVMYRSEIRGLIGEVICPDNILMEPLVPYIPLFYQNSLGITCGKFAESKFMQQPLCHLYFLTVLEHLLDKQYTQSSLQRGHSLIVDFIRLTSSIQTKLKSAVGGEAALLQIEHEALVQVILQQVAEHLNPDETHKIITTIEMADEINLLLDDERIDCNMSHGMMLSLYLWKKLNSWHQFASLMTTRLESIQHIKCIKQVSTKYKVTLKMKPQLLDFLQLDNGLELTELYKNLATLMMEIHNKMKRADDLISYADTCCKQFSRDGTDGHLVFRMMVWLVTFYEFFEKKIVSEKLSKIMTSQDMMRYLQDKGCINLIQCFLLPNHMIKRKEKPIPFTTEDLLHLKSEHILSTESDPVYSLFMPENQGRYDQSDIDLQYALVNLIAVILGSPTHSNHLWYHLFGAETLKNTYITGFIYNSAQENQLQNGYGINLFMNGQFAYKDYLQQAYSGTYTLHSLYFLLWANFGAFCMALLTQSDKQDLIHSIIISRDVPIRHYCVSQLKILWNLLCRNMGLSYELRSFFVSQALCRLFQVQTELLKSLDDQNRNIELRGVFESQEQLSCYEKWWHLNIYQHTWDQLHEKFSKLCAQEDLPLFKNLLTLDVRCPHFPTLHEFQHCYLGSGKLQQLSLGGSFCFMYHFALNWEKLQCGGTLLPDLLEFYQFLHTNLSNIVTVDQAMKITVGRTIELAMKNSKQEYAKYIKTLYERMKTNYNEYTNTYVKTRSIVCTAKHQNQRMFAQLSDDVPLLNLLSDLEEEQGSDILYTVMSDIIESHNQTMKILFSSIQDDEKSIRIPDNPPEIHSTEISLDTAIVGQFHDHGESKILQLLRSFYQPLQNQLQESRIPLFHVHSSSAILQGEHEAVYDLKNLERSIVDEFIAGKPVITSCNSLRVPFQFKKENADCTEKSVNVANMALDIQHVGEKLPDSFKISLSHDDLKRMEYEFHSSSYHLLNEVVVGLQTVIGHLIKSVSESPNQDHTDLKKQQVKQFMLNLYVQLRNPNEVLQEIGIHNARHSHLSCLEDLHIVCVFDCLRLFFKWIEEGYYDYSNIPFPFKVQMNDKDKIFIEHKIRSHWKGSIGDLVEKLQELVDVLKHLEQDIISKVKDAASISMLDYLLQYLKCGEKKGHITQLLPRSILLQHYVAFRISLRKLLLEVHQELQRKEEGQKAKAIWLEFDSDLWEKHLPHLRKGIYSKVRIIYDPKIDYGFQDDTDEKQVSINPLEKQVDMNALEFALQQDAKESVKDEPLELEPEKEVVDQEVDSGSSEEEMRTNVGEEIPNTEKSEALDTDSTQKCLETATSSGLSQKSVEEHKPLPHILPKQQPQRTDQEDTPQAKSAVKKKMNKKMLAEWLENEGVDEDDAALLKNRGVTEIIFLKMKPGDKWAKDLSEATIDMLPDLQESLRST